MTQNDAHELHSHEENIINKQTFNKSNCTPNETKHLNVIN